MEYNRIMALKWSCVDFRIGGSEAAVVFESGEEVFDAVTAV